MLSIILFIVERGIACRIRLIPFSKSSRLSTVILLSMASCLSILFAMPKRFSIWFMSRLLGGIDHSSEWSSLIASKAKALFWDGSPSCIQQREFFPASATIVSKFSNRNLLKNSPFIFRTCGSRPRLYHVKWPRSALHIYHQCRMLALLQCILQLSLPALSSTSCD